MRKILDTTVAKLAFNVGQPLFLALGISLAIVALGIVVSGKSYRAGYINAQAAKQADVA